MAAIHRFASGLCGLAALLLAAAAPAADQPLGSLQVAPAAVELCAGREALVRVTASEAGAAALHWQSSGNVVISASTLPGDTDRAASRTWLLKLKPPDGDWVPGVVHLFAGPKDARSAATSSGSLEVKGVAAEAAASSIKAELDAAWDTLDDRQTLPLRLLLSNPSAVPVRVVSLHGDAAPFDLAPAAGAASAPFSIAPGGLVVLPYTLRIDHSARQPSGKQRVSVRVDAESRPAGCPRSWQVMASHDFGFNIFGESAVLTAMGIPAFLLVPGFLVVMAPLLLWQLGWRPGLIGSRTEFPFPALKPEFWTLAVSISLLVWLLGSSVWPNMFVVYRLEQVALVWAVSLGASALLYSVYVLFTRSREAGLKAADAQRTYTTQDSAIDLLGRMALRGARMDLRRAPVDLALAKQGSGVHPALILEREKDGVWVVPGIVYTWTEDPIPAALEALLDAALKSGDTVEVYRILGAANGRQLQVRWSEEGDVIRRPLRVPARAVGQEGSLVRLVGND